ncbi:MFS transporter, DHA2 family, multidrug resistance protein [Granulicella rosea]|uniref:MFS transporter, DHA2 family, multidrug resistance protein n=1 Tax=Granulicella rosea TaxID=474952 RepID=A0A239IJY3_9BACT|nr:DHA2 family efflux MFS transporter permease subunit [Granulicella rosea]SNS94076.1 MFS transporter, DHA2 family, multidrug resistance protein [Granulicella rosea]
MPATAEPHEHVIAEAEQSLAEAAPAFDNQPAAAPRVFNPWIVALVVTIGTFMEVLDTSIANVALPHISGSLSASQDEGAWVLTSYLVANAIVLPISGWLSSILGRKRFYLISVFFFTVFSAACGLAPTLGMLILFRVAQGLAGGGLQPSVQAILADTFSAQKRGMAMALYTVAILVAPVLGPTLGGWITDNYSWRWIFYINIPVGMLCVFLTRMVLQDPPHMIEAKARARKLSVDWAGLGFISIGLATLEIVLDKGQELDWFGSSFIVAFASISLIALVSAVLWELYTDHPVVNLRLLKERNFLFCCLIILGLYGVLYATTYLLPVFMQQMLGYDATTAGLALSPAGLFTMIEVPIVGFVLTRGYDPRKMVFSGMILIASACWWMGSLNLDISEKSMILPRIVQVLGLGLITVPVSTMVFRFIPKTESSQAAGLYALVRNEGGSLGIALVSTMLQRRTQMFQMTLGQHITATTGAVQQAVRGQGPDQAYFTLANLYAQMQRQATLLAYMDQFKMLAVMMLCMLPLVFFLKRPPVQKHIELDAH